MGTKVLLSIVAGVVLFATTPQVWGQARSGAEPDLESRRTLLSRVLASANPGKTPASLFGLGRTTRETWDGADWQYESRTDHGYSGVRRTSTVDYEWVEFQWAPSRRTVYDENGMVRSVELWDPVSQTPIPLVQYSYEFAYDFTTNRSVLSAILEQEWDGAVWLDRNRTTFQVENDPVQGLKVVGGQSDTRGVSDWDPVESFVQAEVGDDVVLEYRVWDSGAWVNTDRIIFSNHTIGSLNAHLAFLAKRYGEFEDVQLSLLMLPPGVYQEWNGAEWENVSRHTVDSYHFVTGDPISILYESWVVGGHDRWEAESRLELAFEQVNSSWRISSSSLQAPSQFGWMTVIHEAYSHDDRRLLTGAVQTFGFAGIFQNNARYAYSWSDLSVGRDDPGTVPTAHVLEPAYPNPFNPTTRVTYRLATTDNVRLEVRDALGRLVRVLVDERRTAGVHRVDFDAGSLPSGLYAIQMTTPGQRETRLVTLVK